MLWPTRGSPIGRFGLVLQLTVGLTGCHSWRTQTVSPREVVETQHPPRIRVSLTSKSELTLEAPEIQGDTLFGHVGEDPKTRKPIGLPLSVVEQVAVRQSDAGKTAVALVGGAGAAVVLLGLLSLALDPPD